MAQDSSTLENQGAGPTETAHALRSLRLVLGLSLDEAAALVHTSRRSWERWEAGRSVPPVTLELLQLKTRGEFPKPGGRDMVVVLRREGDFDQPIDVVAADNYVDHTELGDGNVVIRSLATDSTRALPFVHETKFVKAHNDHVMAKLNKWPTFAQRAGLRVV